MKLSNLLLSLVAIAALGLAVGAGSFTVHSEPTSVIHIPSEKGQQASFSMKLPKDLNKRQLTLLSMAYDIAKRDGHTHPQLLQGIILQESHAGNLTSYKVAGQEFGLKTNERYYGVAQIKLVAAKDAMARFPSLRSEFGFQSNTDEEIIAKLIENDKFNLSVASKYLLVLKTYGYNSVRELALAYNQGAGGAKSKDPATHHYSNGVDSFIKKISRN